MQMTMTCAEESRAADEALAGTFKPADTFFLIQSNPPEFGSWGGDAVKTAAQAGALAPCLQHLQSMPRAKIIFIRRPRASGKNFYIAKTNQAQPKLYHAELDDYTDLLDLDSASLTGEGAPHIKGRAMEQVDALYTVCTNGRHDPCCAQYGTPVYQALVDQAGAETVWQTTHIGGHRLAATMIAFPQGIVYGQVDPPDVEAIVTNHRAGYLLAHKYRGRGAYTGQALAEDAHLAAGAAEAAIREETRLYRIADLQLTQVAEIDGGQRRVHFIDAAGQRYSADVRTLLSSPRQTSCGDVPKPMPQHEVSLRA